MHLEDSTAVCFQDLSSLDSYSQQKTVHADSLQGSYPRLLWRFPAKAHCCWLQCKGESTDAFHEMPCDSTTGLESNFGMLCDVLHVIRSLSSLHDLKTQLCYLGMSDIRYLSTSSYLLLLYVNVGCRHQVLSRCILQTWLLCYLLMSFVFIQNFPGISGKWRLCLLYQWWASFQVNSTIAGCLEARETSVLDYSWPGCACCPHFFRSHKS